MNFLGALGVIFIDIIETIVIALSIFVIIYLIAFQPHEVNGESMTGIGKFHNGQYILTDKFTYKLREPKRGEVVVFQYPLDKNYDYIKRIIALPGEKVMLSANRIYIYNAEHPSGFILDESAYISEDILTQPRQFLKENEILSIPKDYYFVMGDNRPHSSDSRAWGVVPKNLIIGKSFLRYWPANEFGLIINPVKQ